MNVAYWVQIFLEFPHYSMGRSPSSLNNYVFSCIDGVVMPSSRESQSWAEVKA